MDGRCMAPSTNNAVHIHRTLGLYVWLTKTRAHVLSATHLGDRCRLLIFILRSRNVSKIKAVYPTGRKSFVRSAVTRVVHHGKHERRVISVYQIDDVRTT